MLKNKIVDKFNNKSISNARESKTLRNSLNLAKSKVVCEQKKNKISDNNLSNSITSTKMLEKKVIKNVKIADEKPSHNTNTLKKIFPIPINNNANKDMKVSKELDLSKSKDHNLIPSRIKIIPKSKLHSFKNESTIQKLNSNLNTNMNSQNISRNIPGFPKIKDNILTNNKLMVVNPKKINIYEREKSNNEISSISFITSNKTLTSHNTNEKRITIQKIKKFNNFQNILSNLNNSTEKHPNSGNTITNAYVNTNALRKSVTNILRKENSIIFNNNSIINNHNSSFLTKQSANNLKETKKLPIKNHIINIDNVEKRTKIKNLTTNFNLNHNSMIVNEFHKKNKTITPKYELMNKINSKNALNASTNLNSTAYLKTNLNSNHSVTIPKNNKLQNQIRDNPQSFQSIQNLKSINKLQPKNHKKENFITHIKDNSQRSTSFKVGYGKAKPNIPMNKKQNDSKRSYEQFNLDNKRNLNKNISKKNNLTKNFSEVNQYKNLLLRNPNQQIDLYINPKIHIRDLNNTISNESLGSFSLIHEKSEMNSNTKQENCSRLTSSMKSNSKSNSKEMNVLEFDVIDQLIEIEKNQQEYREAEVVLDRDYNNNCNEIEELEGKNVEEYYYESQAEDVESVNGQQEDVEEETGVLTVDQVKDIIVYFDFDELDADDQCLFYENDYQEFEFYQKYKYMKYFFNKKSLTIQSDDIIDVSPSTKASSSNRQTLIPLISK